MPCLICWHFFRFLFFTISRNADTERLFRHGNFTLVLKRAVFACLQSAIEVSGFNFHGKQSLQTQNVIQILVSVRKFFHHYTLAFHQKMRVILVNTNAKYH